MVEPIVAGGPDGPALQPRCRTAAAEHVSCRARVYAAQPLNAAGLARNIAFPPYAYTVSELILAKVVFNAIKKCI
jgi:hypothetical protein